MMFLESGIKKECCGCFACMAVCPNDAVTRRIHEDGFLYQEINSSLCVKCGAYYGVCPNENPVLFPNALLALVGKIKNHNDFMKSSSGGAFRAIVRAYAEKYDEFFVCGAAFDKNFRVRHKIIRYSGLTSIDEFSKSKYVQSDSCNALKELSENKDMRVIFSGTPCQVMAARRIIGDSENILFIDILCKGVPSQKLFDDYRKKLERDYESPLKKYELRTKETLENGTNYTRSVRFEFEDGTIRRLNRLEDDLLKIFYSAHVPYRQSCIHCMFKQTQRTGSITIGDAWGIEKIYSDFIPVRGVSLILVNDSRYMNLIPALHEIMELRTVELSGPVINENSALGGEI